MRNNEITKLLSGLDDSSLIDCIRQHKPCWHTAAGILLNRHRRQVMLRCHRWLGNPLDAEDAAQETLLRAYRALSAFRGHASFRTWLFAIADNNCRRLAARRARREISNHLRRTITLHEELCLQAPSLPDNASIRAVLRVLDCLPAQVRDILVLRYFREFCLEEIAKTLDIGLSAAKMRLYRSLEQFKGCYSHMQAEMAHAATTLQRNRDTLSVKYVTRLEITGSKLSRT